jgi:hypothetical protein
MRYVNDDPNLGVMFLAAMLVPEVKYVKLYLCLTKYHAMNTYPVLYQTSRYEDVWGNGSIAPPILSLGSHFTSGLEPPVPTWYESVWAPQPV